MYMLLYSSTITSLHHVWIRMVPREHLWVVTVNTYSCSIFTHLHGAMESHGITQWFHTLSWISMWNHSMNSCAEHAAVVVTRVVTHLCGLQRIYTAWVIAFRRYLSLSAYYKPVGHWRAYRVGRTQKAKACTSSLLNCTVLLVLQYIGFKSILL